MTDPVVTAAIPSLISALQAVNTFIADMGTDPNQLALRFPGAVQKLVGTLELQLPVLATAELSALQSDVQSRISGLIADLQKQQAT
jgi:hypothetical protein